jgi:hypothetical protein
LSNSISSLLVRKNEIIKLGNEVILLGIDSRIVHGWPCKRLCKINSLRMIIWKIMKFF